MRPPAVLALAFGVLLASCGKTCLGPFGGCFDDAAAATGTTSSSGISIVVPSQYPPFQVFSAGSSIALSATNGTGNYLWTQFGTGTLSATTGGSVTFTIPATLASSPQTTVIQVQDSATLKIYKIAITAM